MADERTRRPTGAVPTTGAGPLDDRTRRPTGAVPVTPMGPTASGRIPVAREPRAAMVVPIRYRYQSFIEFVETQSVNVSRSGMFVATADPLPVGTILDFQFTLADGFALLKGRAEVVRVTGGPVPGMGVRFQDLDEGSRTLIDRIVEVNASEGKKPTVPAELADPGAAPDFAAGRSGGTPAAAGLDFQSRELRVQINPATVGYFTNNPLLNIRLGGFVVPGPEEVPLGFVYSVTVHDVQGQILFVGRGKVVAKHDKRLGIRLVDADKATLGRLQTEIARYGGTGK